MAANVNSWISSELVLGVVFSKNCPSFIICFLTTFSPIEFFPLCLQLKWYSTMSKSSTAHLLELSYCFSESLILDITYLHRIKCVSCKYLDIFSI